MTSSMIHRSDHSRIIRLRIWILVLTLTPACIFLVLGSMPVAAGLAAGGLIVFINLLGTQRTVTHIIEGDGIERTVAFMFWIGKFGITAAVILGLLCARLVDALALLIGLVSLPLSLIFDIFLFPVNKEEAKKP